MAAPTENRVCPTHGQFTSVNYLGSRWSECPTCASEEHADREAAHKRREAREALQDRLHSSGLLGRSLDASFENYLAETAQQRVVLDACRQFATTLDFNVWGGPWLIGPPGTGKTHLGAAMVNAVIRAGHSAHIASARGIVQRLRATWAKSSSETEAQVVDQLAYAGLLVIDEVGVGFGTDSEAVQLLDVVDRRYQLCGPTVLLSNLNQPALRAAVGDRLFDRLRENNQVLICDWPSHRGTPR